MLIFPQTNIKDTNFLLLEIRARIYRKVPVLFGFGLKNASMHYALACFAVCGRKKYK